MSLIYDNDEYINKPLYSIVVLLLYLILFIFIIIICVSLYDFGIFIYNTSVYNILINEEENMFSKNITEDFHYRTLNYIKCFEDDDTKSADLSKTNNGIFGIIYLLSGNDKYKNEKDFNILFQYNLYNIIFKSIVIITFFVFLSTAINFFIAFFLRKRNYTINGADSIKDYIGKNNNTLIIKLIYVFITAIIIYLVIYKVYFIDIIYNDIYTVYKSILQLDSFILDEANKINKVDKYFFTMLKNIIIKQEGNLYTISKDSENYIIEDNIEKTSNDKIKTSKYLILGFYKYMINISQDNDIVNKINNFIIHKNDNMEYNKTISLRDYLPILLNLNNTDKKIDVSFNFKKINDDLKKNIEFLKYILKNLDNNISILSNITYNILRYNILLNYVNILILLLIIYLIYTNNYEDDNKTADKDKNFVIIKDLADVAIKYMSKKNNEETKIDSEETKKS